MRTPSSSAPSARHPENFSASLKTLQAPQLGAIAVREAVARAGVDPVAVEECIMGNVLSAGVGQAPARQAALNGGLSNEVAALTINKVCGSGLKAVMLAAQGIALGDIDIAVAGGMESMSNAPYLLPRAREGLRMGDASLVDSMIHDGLWCAFEHCHMGMSGEHVADVYGVSREEQDRYAAESHQKAARAAADGRFTRKSCAVEVPQAKGSPIVFDRDETIRPDSTVDVLKGLKPAFKKDGSVTAGNAPGVNDGAAALVVMSEERATSLGATPMARIAGYATSGLAPKLLLMTPVESIRKLLKTHRLAARRRRSVRNQRSVRRADGRDHQGARPRCGARQRQRRRDCARSPNRRERRAGADDFAVCDEGARGAKRGIASLCLGGGNGVALAVEM